MTTEPLRDNTILPHRYEPRVSRLGGRKPPVGRPVALSNENSSFLLSLARSLSGRSKGPHGGRRGRLIRAFRYARPVEGRTLLPLNISPSLSIGLV